MKVGLAITTGLVAVSIAPLAFGQAVRDSHGWPQDVQLGCQTTDASSWRYETELAGISGVLEPRETYDVAPFRAYIANGGVTFENERGPILDNEWALVGTSAYHLEASVIRRPDGVPMAADQDLFRYMANPYAAGGAYTRQITYTAGVAVLVFMQVGVCERLDEPYR